MQLTSEERAKLIEDAQKKLAVKRALFSVSDADLTSTMRGATSVKVIDFNDIARLSPNIGNTAIREGMIFRILGFVSIESSIQDQSRERLGVRIEDQKGEQRTIFASSLLRKLPAAGSNRPEHFPITDEVLNFDLGILKGHEGEDDGVRALMLVGNGTDFIKVGPMVQDKLVREFTNASAAARVKKNVGDPVEIVNTFHNLTFIPEAEAKAIA